MCQTSTVGNISQESLYIPLSHDTHLHLRRISTDGRGAPVLMIHGSIENGRIFYTTKGKGFAPFLAAQGYDVFVADLRGKGQSTPPIHKHAAFGQTDAIREDIPAFLGKIRELRGETPIHFVAHSWGGVLFLAYLAREPVAATNVASMVMFGTKRRITVMNRHRFLQIDIIWNIIGRALTSLYGYLPIGRLGIGSDNEARRFFLQTTKWIYQKEWLDPEDGFDYGAALRKKTLPPALYVTGINDLYLGHPYDVQLLMGETGQPQHEFWLLGRKNGNVEDYGHINILTHPKAPEDHFPEVVQWMGKQTQ